VALSAAVGIQLPKTSKHLLVNILRDQSIREKEGYRGKFGPKVNGLGLNREPLPKSSDGFITPFIYNSADKHTRATKKTPSRLSLSRGTIVTLVD